MYTGPAHHSLFMPVGKRMQHSTHFSSPAPLSSELPTLKRLKDGIIVCWVATVLYVTLRNYSTTCLEKTATATAWTSLWHFLLFRTVGCLGGVCGCCRFSQHPQSPVHSRQPWGVSLSGPQMIRKTADPSGWNWQGDMFVTKDCDSSTLHSFVLPVCGNIPCVSSWQLVWCPPLLNCEQLWPIRAWIKKDNIVLARFRWTISRSNVLIGIYWFY